MPNPRILILIVILIVTSTIFLFWELHGHIWFILELRMAKLVGLIIVGSSVGIATVMFQTISGNRILTPSIMGFDALFVLIKTTLIFFFGAIGYAQFPTILSFIGETTLMVSAAIILFVMLLGRQKYDIQLMILVGVIFGILFRSLSIFMQRLIAPSEFAILQKAMFASFGFINQTELIICFCICIIAIISAFSLSNKLDVASLGRSTARSLGLNFDAVQIHVLILIAVLTSVTTTLVGPITFLGLLVASLAHSLMGTHRHILLLPAAALISAITLVVGQTLFERILHMQSTLSIVIEFIGGLLFLFLVAKKRIY